MADREVDDFGRMKKRRQAVMNEASPSPEEGPSRRRPRGNPSARGGMAAEASAPPETPAADAWIDRLPDVCEGMGREG
eukprot:CAMPEP_0117889406 /NCGR_PEP_ID=MMETSP0950-20121206/22602_1 /TAXON_ID=44440 /ORGANISM="Chattonella subsalsa, Strain CCMP2191" /LENGTH=77 /DNA_ID=CAMNT_0005748249 /DNA_START=195 /DNA_END=425 /DNA_ORIENTATION=-